MKKCNCTKSFFCHLKPNKSLGSPDFGSPVIQLLTGPVWSGPAWEGTWACRVWPGQVPGHARACQQRLLRVTIINAKSQCKKVSSEQEPGRLCSKEAEGAGCECQGTLGFHILMCSKDLPF